MQSIQFEFKPGASDAVNLASFMLAYAKHAGVSPKAGKPSLCKYFKDNIDEMATRYATQINTSLEINDPSALCEECALAYMSKE